MKTEVLHKVKEAVINQIREDVDFHLSNNTRIMITVENDFTSVDYYKGRWEIYHVDSLDVPRLKELPNITDWLQNKLDEITEEWYNQEDTCGFCNGSGEGSHDGSTCHACGGSGSIKRS